MFRVVLICISMHHMCILFHTLLGPTLEQPQSGLFKLGLGASALRKALTGGLLIHFLLPSMAQVEVGLGLVGPGSDRTTKLPDGIL